MAGSLSTYMVSACRSLGLRSLVLTDTDGVEIARGGEEMEETQMLAAIFQSTIESTAKVSCGTAKTIILHHARFFLIQKNMSSLYLTAVCETEGLLGKTLASLDRIQQDLVQVIQLFANTEAV